MSNLSGSHFWQKVMKEINVVIVVAVLLQKKEEE
jgi:hypothetical protein